ncbi:MAG: 50S ribosomal protein L34 [Tenericutes bacterium]|nr:50S ribosomal protein L34 [Mycoplasmatota bacterium]
MKLTPVAKKNNKAKKQGFLSRSKNILKSRRNKGRKNLINK